MTASTGNGRRIVFCDFDGTITATETFIGMLRRFSSADYGRVRQDIIDGKTSLRDGVRQMLEAIPSDRFDPMQTYIARQQIRPGFARFLDFLAARSVPFVIVSGGLTSQIGVLMKPFEHRIHSIHAATVSTDGPFLTVHSDYDGPRELVQKEQVMAAYAGHETIVIGDGVTDVALAERASLVFARDQLMGYLSERRVPFIRWDDFNDIQAVLEQRWRFAETAQNEL